ncbi:MAG: hypothetical protein QG579_551 [Patescibacteria group bacterium]|nr:hypothetical protein [Patescibacteria group bacterium]
MLKDRMGFNRLVGRYNPYSSDGVPYLLQQNAKIREMNSLIIRNSANLYKKIADPFGANPYGEFGTGLGTATTGGPGVGMTDTGIPPEEPVQQAPVETPLAQTPVAETPIAETPLTQTPVAETPIAETPLTQTPVAQPVALPVTTSTAAASGAREPTYKYNRVDVGFCNGYYNCPWWDWRLNSDQQIALNLLQTNGDELILQYKAETNTYPRLASEFYMLPTTIADFTLYNYSDRQMAYLYFHRDPHEVNLGAPAYQKYAIKWADAFTQLHKRMSGFGVYLTWDDMKILARADTVLLPTYVTSTNENGNLKRTYHYNGGYLNDSTCYEYKKTGKITDPRFSMPLPEYMRVFRPANEPPEEYTTVKGVTLSLNDFHGFTYRY